MSDRQSQGFPGACRLRVSREYTRVWRQGERYHTPHLTVIIATGQAPVARLGITVSRKVGNAVCRNRIKRWVREFFRHRRQLLADVVDISVIAKPGAAMMAHVDLERELLDALRRLRVIGHA